MILPESVADPNLGNEYAVQLKIPVHLGDANGCATKTLVLFRTK